MSRNASPEERGTAALNKAISHLTRQRRWKGDWELFDSTKKNRSVSWEQFHDRPNTRISAITTLTVNGSTWWIEATYESGSTFADLVAFGLMGAQLPKNKLCILVCNVNPRTDDKYPWDNDGNVRKYIRSRDDWREFVKSH